MGSIVKRILIVIAALLAVAVIVVGGYVVYLTVTYNRIVDSDPVAVENNVPETWLKAGEEYTATTYNIGFGAYTPDYTFFMDEGIMADGTKTVGVLSEGFSVVKPDNLADVSTCRGSDIPYEKGVSYTATIDGFIVSSNVEATARNIDTGFANSDHNPVLLTFKLKSAA